MTAKKLKTAIVPTREENYSEWYLKVIQSAELAESSPVRGSMIIRPYGYAIWENIQSQLNQRFKRTGHKNAYFPLLIPLDFFEKEAEHVDGFAKECAVVTHHRLEVNDDGKLVPGGELEEPYVIRPTSETIIGHQFSKWIQSHRDLPLLINQWANIMRWEMRTRLFLRTSEILWQEGHTAHATADEAEAKTLQMAKIYADFAQDVLAVPVILGEKTPEERFPGALHSLCIEALMQDNKALQAGTSHYLGQNFARTFNIDYTNENGERQLCYTTSWGVSTRLIGALIMSHSDDNGLIVPPRIAPTHVVIQPILRKSATEEDNQKIIKHCEELCAKLLQIDYHGISLWAEVDKREISGGQKSWDNIKKGYPIRLEIGPRDIEQNNVTAVFRTKITEKQSILQSDFLNNVTQYLDSIQQQIWQTASERLKNNLFKIDDINMFEKFFDNQADNNQFEKAPGLAEIFVDESADYSEYCEKFKISARCIYLNNNDNHDNNTIGKCIFTGKETTRKVVFGKAY